MRLTREEVATHNKDDDCWVIMMGMVLNITRYLEYHPGGPAILKKFAGQDITRAFRRLVIGL